MNYEEKKLRIVMWLLVAMLVLSVTGVSLAFALSRTPAQSPNTVNVGSRITGGGVQK